MINTDPSQHASITKLTLTAEMSDGTSMIYEFPKGVESMQIDTTYEDEGWNGRDFKYSPLMRKLYRDPPRHSFSFTPVMDQENDYYMKAWVLTDWWRT